MYITSTYLSGLLIIMLYLQPNAVFCHPLANCFHQNFSIENVNNTASNNKSTNNSLDSRTDVVQKIRYMSTFFVGLSFPDGLKSIDLTPIIQVSNTKIQKILLCYIYIDFTYIVINILQDLCMCINTYFCIHTFVKFLPSLTYIQFLIIFKEFYLSRVCMVP